MRVMMAVALVSLACAAASEGADEFFDGCRTFDTGGRPYAVVTMDFDEDGVLDLATANSNSRSVSVLLGEGDGRFRPGRGFDVGLSPQALVAFDANEDGCVDLATANHKSRDVSILIGDGTGRFRLAATLPAGDGPRAIVAADFDENGHVDLAAANYLDDSVSVFTGDGLGSFLAANAVTGTAAPIALAAGDFVGDSRPDLAVLSYGPVDGSLSFLAGVGAGGFSLALSVGAGNTPTGLAAADLDEDGDADFVVANRLTATLSVILGEGGGTFNARPAVPTGSTPVGLAVIDTDRDGNLDVAAACAGRYSMTSDFISGLSIHAGDGSGDFAPYRLHRCGGLPVSLACGDFDLDGLGDFALANLQASSVSLLLGRADGSYADVNSYDARAGRLVFGRDMQLGDLNLDGHVDVFGLMGRFASLLGDGNGAFAPGPSPAFEADTGAAILTSGDFDEDGRIDLALGYHGARGIELERGDGTGRFEPLGSVPEPSPFCLGSADLDGDGVLDLLVGVGDSFGEFSLRVYLGDGTGGFRTNGEYGPVGCGRFAFADFDGDGDLDVASTDNFRPELIVLPNLGAGVLGPQAIYGPVSVPKSIDAVDVDEDGRLDLVVAFRGYTFEPGGGIALFLGDGTGGFGGPPREIVTVRRPTAGVVADFDADGHLDFLLSNESGSHVTLLVGDGTGDFRAAGDFAVGSSPLGVVAADVNEDGRVDAVVATAPGVSVLRVVPFAGDACARGNVNARAGAVVDVLFVNGSAGDAARRVSVTTTDPLEIEMAAPPATPDGGFAPFALYTWPGAPNALTSGELRFGLGAACMSMPISYRRVVSPGMIWNNWGFTPWLGAPTSPSNPAPSIVASLPSGSLLSGTYFLQGLIADPASPSGLAAVTNGVTVVIR